MIYDYGACTECGEPMLYEEDEDERPHTSYDTDGSAGGECHPDCCRVCHNPDEGYWFSMPQPFIGPVEVIRRNFASHVFVSLTGDPEDEDVRCLNCDAKPHHAAARYFCGVEPPRVKRWIEYSPEWIATKARLRAEKGMP